MSKSNSTTGTEIERRQFIKWISLSSLYLTLPLTSCNFGGSTKVDLPTDLSDFKNVYDFERLSKKVMGEDALLYLNGGADDLKTVQLNSDAYQEIQIRARRLIDVTNVSTKVNLLGQTLYSKTNISLNEQVNVSNLSKGTYFIRIITPSYNFNDKVIVH